MLLKVIVYILGLLVFVVVGFFCHPDDKLHAVDKQFFMVHIYIKVSNGSDKYFKHRISLFHLTVWLGMPFYNQVQIHHHMLNVLQLPLRSKTKLIIIVHPNRI